MHRFVARPVRRYPTAVVCEGGRAFEPGEQQPATDLRRGSLAIYPAGVGRNLAQTFTPGSNQWLGYLERMSRSASRISWLGSAYLNRRSRHLAFHSRT